MNLWLQSPKTYRNRYFFGADGVETAAMTLGHNTALALEFGEMAGLVQYAGREVELNCEVAGVKLKGILDTFDQKTLKYRDYKTGKRKAGKSPWDKVKVFKNIQLLFYGVMIRKIYGRFPKSAYLDWLEVENGKLTGHIETYDCPLDDKRLDLMEKRIAVVAKEISDDYRKTVEAI